MNAAFARLSDCLCTFVHFVPDDLLIPDALCHQTRDLDLDNRSCAVGKCHSCSHHLELFQLGPSGI